LLPNALRTRSWRPRNWPAGECRQPVDGGCVVFDRLRIGESSGARLAGQLGSDERERLLGEIAGQFGRHARCATADATSHIGLSGEISLEVRAMRVPAADSSFASA